MGKTEGEISEQCRYHFVMIFKCHVFIVIS